MNGPAGAAGTAVVAGIAVVTLAKGCAGTDGAGAACCVALCGAAVCEGWAGCESWAGAGKGNMPSKMSSLDARDDGADESLTVSVRRER